MLKWGDEKLETAERLEGQGARYNVYCLSPLHLVQEQEPQEGSGSDEPPSGALTWHDPFGCFVHIS